jgi:hypothetical protein
VTIWGLFPYIFIEIHLTVKEEMPFECLFIVEL